MDENIYFSMSQRPCNNHKNNIISVVLDSISVLEFGSRINASTLLNYAVLQTVFLLDTTVQLPPGNFEYLVNVCIDIPKR